MDRRTRAANNCDMEALTPTPSPAPRRSIVFQNAYVWFVLLSTLDVICTWIVLYRGGVELNPVAAKVISFGPKGLVAYKFAFVVFVILICEIVGRHTRRGAWILIGSAIGLTCIPVVVGLVQLIAVKYNLPV